PSVAGGSKSLGGACAGHALPVPCCGRYVPCGHRHSGPWYGCRRVPGIRCRSHRRTHVPCQFLSMVGRAPGLWVSLTHWPAPGARLGLEPRCLPVGLFVLLLLLSPSVPR